MYKNPAEWFACNYTKPKRINNAWFTDQWEPSGLEAQYQRIVSGNLGPKEEKNFHGIKRSHCGYLGEILLSSGINWLMTRFYPESKIVSRLATWEEDTTEKIDVVVFKRDNPNQKVGVQVKLSKNSRSIIDKSMPILGLRLEQMNLGMEHLMYLQSLDPPYMEKPSQYIRDRFSGNEGYLESFMDALFYQTNKIVSKQSLSTPRAHNQMQDTLLVLCGQNYWR